MISVSLNEIYSETYKALRSVKTEWSLAKDCANKAKWLAQHDQYFLGSILKTADLYKNNKISISINKNTKKKPLAAALAGLLLVEYVSANKITWEGYIDSSKFLLAAMGIIAEEQQINLILENDQKNIIAFTKDKEIYVNANLDTKISSYYFLKTYNFIKKKNIKFTNLKKNTNVTKLNDKCWERLKSLAFETYVPESETSKYGAGY
tara:strand:- start:1702 stop:2322 length:621 start_codon:yes stop_codon:yes gene_type:complete